MKKLLRASLLALALSFSSASFAAPVHAAATNDILKFYTDGSLASYQTQCAEIIKTQTEATKDETDLRKKIGSSQCQKTFGTVDVFCRVEALSVQGDLNCTFTAPDSSKVVGNPHTVLGEVTKNYDSVGKLVSSFEKGGLKDGDTTGTPPAEGGLSAGGSGVCDNNIGCVIGKLPAMLISGTAFLLLTLSGLLLGVAGVVFNWVVIRTVFQFALYFGTSSSMLVAWGVLRDIANIALLFGFIFMGIATILNTQGMEGYTAKKALPRLIIFAVLLNFSLFATQAVIDVSNGFSSVFASYAQERCDTTTSTAGGASGQTNERCSNIGISGKIISAAGLSRIFPSGFSESFDKPYTYAVMLIILSLLVTVAAMVLFAAAIMLVIRVVVLSLLMVTSPIGFAGMAIPALQGIAKDWWHKLINQAFFAPLYLLMLFISLKLVDGLQEGNTSIADALMGNTASAGNSVTTAATTAGNMQVIVVFIIVIGFMVAALMVAQKMGAYGASFATNSAASFVYGNMTRISNLGAGAAGVGLRSLAASRAASLRRQGREPGLGTAALMRTGTQLKGANLDMRRIVGGALKAGGGSGAVASHATFADMQHEFDDFKSGKGTKQYIEAANKDILIKQLDAVHGDTLEDEALKKKLASMSVKDLEKVHGIKDGVRGLVDNLSAEQFEGLMKGGLSDFEKGKLAQARFAKLMVEVKKAKDSAPSEKDTEEERKKKAKNIEDATSAVKTILKDITKGELESLPADALTEDSVVLLSLSDKQREDLSGSTKRTVEERTRVRNAGAIPSFEARFNAAKDKYAVVTGEGGLRSFNAQQVAKLDKKILTDASVAVELTPAMLMELQESKKLSADDIQKIATHIRGTTASSGHAYVTSGAGAAYWS